MVGDNAPVTLRFLIEDYLAHQRWHLAQLAAPVVANIVNVLSHPDAKKPGAKPGSFACLVLPVGYCLCRFLLVAFFAGAFFAAAFFAGAFFAAAFFAGAFFAAAFFAGAFFAAAFLAGAFFAAFLTANVYLVWWVC